jgi:hypothetical protein
METNENNTSENRFSGIETDFAKGYQNGLAAIDQESYRKFLENTVRYENLTEAIAEKNEEKKRLEDKLLNLYQTTSLYHDRLQLHQHNLSTQHEKLGRFKKLFDKTEAETERYEEEKQKIYSHYSLIAGLLFVAAGIVFMAGDLIISHEIVAYALNIRNNFEAWAFATGLAALSILFKPAYDRLFEQPWNKLDRSVRNEKNYIILKAGIVSFAIITLFVLGWFRFEAYRINEEKSQLNRLISSLKTEDMSPEVVKQVEDLVQQQKNLGTVLINSTWGLLSFVLTGILFAISGAICLGVGLPILQYFWRRWLQIPIRMRLLKIRRKRYLRRVEKTEQIVAGENTHKNICEYELNRQKETEWVESEIKALKLEIEKLQNERMQADAERRIALYADGYENGYATQEENSSNATSVSRKTTKTLLEGEDKSFIIKDVIKRSQPKNRPHLALRNMISDNNFKEK